MAKEMRTICTATSFLSPPPLHRLRQGSANRARRTFPACRTVPSSEPRRALIAGGADSGGGLCGRLIADGVRGMHLPLTRARRTSACAELESAVLRLGDFDVVSFAAAAAVQPFADAMLGVAGGDAAVAAIALRASGVRVAAGPQHAQLVRRALDVATDLVALAEDPVAVAQLVRAAGAGRSVLCPLPACRGMRAPERWEAGVDAFAGKGVRVTCGELLCVERRFVDAEIEMLLRGEVKYLVVEGLEDAVALAAVLGPEEEATVRDLVDVQRVVTVVASHEFVAEEVKTALGISRVSSLSSISFEDGAVKFIEDREYDDARKSQTLFLV